jgi:hypothetical protein
MGQPDFRVGGRIFATLATQHLAYGNVKRTPEQQVEEMPEVFLPVGGGWGRTGMTHVRLAAASEDVLRGALQTAWKLRVDTNAKVSHQSAGSAKRKRGRAKMKGTRK